MVNKGYCTSRKSGDKAESKVKTRGRVRSKAKAEGGVESRDEEKEGGSSLPSN